MTWGNWNKGRRCPDCAFKDGKSSTEKEVVKYVEGYGITIFENDRTQILNPNTKKFLELDIWIPSLRKAIEVNGRYWHEKKETKKRDRIKKKVCMDNNISLLSIDDKNWNINKGKEKERIQKFIEEE